MPLSDILNAIYEGARLHDARQARQQQAIERSQEMNAQSARQGQESQEAASRLKYNYDALAQQEKERKDALLANNQRFQAQDALRKQNADALEQYRRDTIQNAQDRIANAKGVKDAAATLKQTQDSDTQSFFTDVANGTDPMKAKAAHPHAQGSDVTKVLSNALSTKTKGSPDANVPLMDFSPPGQDSSLSPSERIRYRGVRVNNPFINASLGTNAPAGTGTNYVGAAAALTPQSGAVPVVAPTASPTVKFTRDKDGNLVPVNPDVTQ